MVALGLASRLWYQSGMPRRAGFRRDSDPAASSGRVVDRRGGPSSALFYDSGTAGARRWEVAGLVAGMGASGTAT